MRFWIESPFAVFRRKVGDFSANVLVVFGNFPAQEHADPVDAKKDRSKGFAEIGRNIVGFSKPNGKANDRKKEPKCRFHKHSFWRFSACSKRPVVPKVMLSPETATGIERGWGGVFSGVFPAKGIASGEQLLVNKGHV
jgi:hypothetical protein